MNDNNDPKRKAILSQNLCNTSTKIHYCSSIWIIHQYYEYHYHSKRHIDSSSFRSTTNVNYRWCVRLFKPDSSKMMKAAVFVKNDEDQLYTDMLVTCKLSIINGKGEETNIHELGPFQELARYNGTNCYFASFLNFLNEADILNKDKLLLEDDTLTLFCEVRFVANKSDTTNVSTDHIIVLPNQIKDGGLQEDLEHLLENEDFSDFAVSINGKKYPVHKTILAARSQVFAAMFKQEMKETHQNFVEISDIDQNVFKEVLRYMYTGKSPNLDDMACTLLLAAEKYDLEHLKTMCEHSLIKKLSIESVVDSLILADTFNVTLLKQQAIQFIKLHMKAVKKTNNWLKIKQRSELFVEVFDAFHQD